MIRIIDERLEPSIDMYDIRHSYSLNNEFIVYYLDKFAFKCKFPVYYSYDECMDIIYDKILDDIRYRKLNKAKSEVKIPIQTGVPF